MRSRLFRALFPWFLVAIIAGPMALYFLDRFEAISATDSVEWKNPMAALLALGGLLVAWIGFHLRTRRSATFAYSRVGEIALARPGLVARLWSLPTVLRVVALGLLAVALARPTTYREEVKVIEGIDIMIVLDLSKSMEERDLRRNRLDAGQRTIRNFIKNRATDRVGLVVFAESAMTQCPLTVDHATLDRIVADLAIGDVPEMGTAIGDALALALGSLKRSETKSKVVILLSDGDSNKRSQFTPREAKDLAQQMGVRVFTILLGREGGAGPFSFGTRHSVNPALLREMATDTGGMFFRAGDDAELEASFNQVRGTLDKTRRTVKRRVPGAELFYLFAIPALFLLLLEVLLSLTRWRRFP